MKYKEIIDLTNDGKIFGATFIKKDGTRRKMCARTGVWTKQRGGTLSYNPKEKQLIIVWDMGKDNFRAIPVDRLEELKVRGKTFKIC